MTDFPSPRSQLLLPGLLLLTLAAIALVTLLGPEEQTLGANVHLVLLHGAWVWTGKIAFAAAALTGLVGLALRRSLWPGVSLALGRTGLAYWLTYLPMSLIVQQQNWGGIFWDEPRWRIPFTFAVVGLLLQIALTLMDQPLLTCAANLVYGVVLWVMLADVTNVLHPNSPIFGSGAWGIEESFVVLVVLGVLSAALLAAMIYRRRLAPPI